jgi:AbrB family looped-hinge helix DNA binding protein
MLTARITSKGQITIPLDIRQKLGLRPGDRVEFSLENGAIYVQKQVADSPFTNYRDYLKHLEGQSVDELIKELRGD